MNVCFVLPKFTRQPIGGYKMVFEYANRLTISGHRIFILFINDDALKQFKLPAPIRNVLANFLTLIEPRWFVLNENIVKLSNLENGYEKKLENIDVCFATGIQTVQPVKKLFPNSKKCYYIQGYEVWNTPARYVHETYSYGFINIVVAEWLKEIVDKHSPSPSILLKNPIDTSIYRMIIPIEDRKEHTIALLYHEESKKGVKYALEAIYRLKNIYTDLTVQMFGMFPKPKGLPEWIQYKRGASQQETVNIYNSSQIFICASVEEGYGLTGLEAMACGAALVSTAYLGVLEYALDGVNALLSPVEEVEPLVENVCKLFNDKMEMMRIVNNGVEYVQRFSWDGAVTLLNGIIKE